MAMNILELPPELITLCLSFLNGKDLAAASQTCHKLKELTSYDSLWQNRCLQEYGLETLEGFNGSYKEVYGKVLLQYGRLIGLWRNVTTCYGGLLQVWYQDGAIVGEELYGQKKVHDALLRKTIFRIYLDELKNVKIIWETELQGRQFCSIQQSQDDVERFSLILEKTELEDSNLDYTLFLAECERRGVDQGLCWFRWQQNLKHQFKQCFERFDLKRFNQRSKLPVKPGLYKGMYGGHGTEIIHLYHDDGKYFAQKIAGDVNVPAGEISIRFTLNDHIVLSREQQRSLDTMDDELQFNEVSFPRQAYDPEKCATQPFVIPIGVFTDDRHAVCPERCLARFAGQGTVSPTGYRHPTLIPVHFVVFSENLFGVLWIQLHSFSLFSRVEEELPALVYELSRTR